MTATTDHRGLHLAALAAGVLAHVVLFALPGGPVDYLICIGVGIIAVAIGHRAARRRGSLLWAGIVGLVFAYLELVVAVGLLVVRVTRTVA
ncbi:hypothetical protein [Leucobacter sp.]